MFFTLSAFLVASVLASQGPTTNSILPSAQIAYPTNPTSNKGNGIQPNGNMDQPIILKGYSTQPSLNKSDGIPTMQNNFVGVTNNKADFNQLNNYPVMQTNNKSNVNPTNGIAPQNFPVAQTMNKSNFQVQAQTAGISGSFVAPQLNANTNSIQIASPVPKQAFQSTVNGNELVLQAAGAPVLSIMDGKVIYVSPENNGTIIIEHQLGDRIIATYYKNVAIKTVQIGMKTFAGVPIGATALPGMIFGAKNIDGRPINAANMFNPSGPTITIA